VVCILSAHENLASCARAFLRIVALENLVLERLQLRFPALLSTKDHAHKTLNFHVRRVYIIPQINLFRMDQMHIAGSDRLSDGLDEWNC
jgi:hypothetical protein